MNLNLCSSPAEARNEGSIYHLFLSFGVEALSDKLGSVVRSSPRDDGLAGWLRPFPGVTADPLL
jgi:hypothetical protein